ncbi:MAG TPA: DUF2298 domain-containing protein [Thermomicrobiales bacterium]|nr:DUF2298 domain-containing protein [Thermomicrobiales bacterium]
MDWFDITLRWYLLTTLATLALAPMTLAAFRRVTDRGASVLRPLSALALVWPIWFLAGIGNGLVPFSAVSLWIWLVIAGILGWTLAWWRRLVDLTSLRHIAIAEAGHLAAFAAFLWFRGFGPMANWQEKPSDLMMLASNMHATSMPPTDAWLSGEPVNYYYLGYTIWAGFGKMIGATPAEAFNLALISIFAMTFIAAVGLGANILAHWYSETISRIGGILAGLFVVVLGNPWATITFLKHPADQWHGTNLGQNYAYFDGIAWKASRVIIDNPDPNFSNPISEFPAFSFILGDLHPHLIALPYTITALMFAWMLLTLGRLRENETFLLRDGWRLAFAGLVIGGLYAMNSWDFPTYLLIALIAFGIGTIGIALRDRIAGGALMVVVALVAWLPFYARFEAPAKSTGTWLSEKASGVPVLGGVLASIASYQGERTSPQEYFSIFGFMYAIAIALIVTEAWRRRDDVLHARAKARGKTWAPDRANQYFALGTAILCFLGSLIVPAPLLVICGLPVIAVWLLLERDIRLTAANIALVLYAIAMIMTLVPEFFYLSDIYGGTRMNTIFKVYYQVWLLMGIASALASVSIWKTFRRQAVARYALPATLAVLIAAGGVYPVVAGQQWLDWRSPDRTWHGIDGLDYLKEDQGGAYAGEYAAIQWLLDNAHENDVILTAGGSEWHMELGRVSSGSGVPTLLGWSGHERQWHLDDPAFQTVISQRVEAIDALYQAPPSPEMLERYGVTLIYVGPTETNGIGLEAQPGDSVPGPFPAASNPDFPGPGWTEVFHEDGSRIYRKDDSR